MEKYSLTDAVAQHLEQASQSAAGRRTETIVGGSRKRLRQSVVTLMEGTRLAEHDYPGESTLQVLSGTVRLDAGDDTETCREGDLLIIPPARHSLTAVTDAAVLLTVAK